MEGNELLRVNHLKKYFQTPHGTLSAVDDVTFGINKRETLGVVGESGCGKSTLGRCILRLHEPTAGEVVFEGKNILACDKKEMKSLRSKMQIIFQDPYASLNPRMTVSQAIAAPLIIQGVYSAKEKEKIQKKVAEMMDVVGLASRLVNSYPHELDGGRRQRIGIARALSLDPKFIVCDEPVSALDVSIQAQVLNLMQDLQQQMGLTYLFITHNLSVVKHLSNQIVVMYLGSLWKKPLRINCSTIRAILIRRRCSRPSQFRIRTFRCAEWCLRENLRPRSMSARGAVSRNAAIMQSRSVTKQAQKWSKLNQVTLSPAIWPAL